MPPNAKSWWDFGGELFPPEALRRVYSVSELTGVIRRLIEDGIGLVWVSGEITNLRQQSSGHVYFSIKDVSAQLACVLFRNEAQAVARELLRDGNKIVARGELTVYEARGQYQLRVLAVESQGMGALQAAFERLKQKLQAEGLFATERKRSLPRYPQRIGLVTSPTGAAIRDILHVIARRNPALEIFLAPCRVQGSGAAEEIASSIRLLNQWAAGTRTAGLDLVLVTRGGGSLEDLWAFNEEPVARAIYESKIPVVSAVGHEIDFTISDFVADLRAATPSAAAEILTEGVFSMRPFIAEAHGRLRELVYARWEDMVENLSRWRQRMERAHPRRRLREQEQRLDDLKTQLRRCAKTAWRERQTAALALFQRLARIKPALACQRRRTVFQELNARFSETARRRLSEKKNAAQSAEAHLRLLSPNHVLNRGYSITLDEATGKVVRAQEEVQPGQRLLTRLKSGQIRSLVEPANDPVGPAGRDV